VIARDRVIGTAKTLPLMNADDADRQSVIAVAGKSNLTAKNKNHARSVGRDLV
jgi:hypothetical protein